jgi:hypothetical protein
MDRFGLFMLGVAVAAGVTAGVAARLIQLIVGRIRGRAFTRSAGWRASSGWALGFALAAFAAAGVMSIGLLVLPLALVVCAVAAWRWRALPEGVIGASLGTGIVLAVIGVMNPTPPNPLPPACLGQTVTLRSGEQAAFSCGGVDGTSWLPLAVALIVVAVAAQVMIDRRKKDRPQAGSALSITA